MKLFICFLVTLVILACVAVQSLQISSACCHHRGVARNMPSQSVHLSGYFTEDKCRGSIGSYSSMTRSRVTVNRASTYSGSSSSTALSAAPPSGADDDSGSRLGVWARRLRRYAVGLFTMAILTFSVGLRGASARPSSRRSSGGRQPAAVARTVAGTPDNVAGEQAGGAVLEEEQDEGTVPTRKVDIELRFSDPEERSKQLSKIGYMLVGATTVVALLQSGGDGKGSKKKKGSKSGAKQSKRQSADSVDTEDLFGAGTATSRTKATSASPAKMSKGMRNLSILPPADELFGDEDAAKFFSGVSDEDTDAGMDTDAGADTDTNTRMTAAKSAAASMSKLPRARLNRLPSVPKSPLPVVEAVDEDADEGVLGVDDDDDVPPSRAAAPAFVPAPTPAPTPMVVPPPSPPPPVQKKNIFDRIFQKSTSNRPTDLTEVMRINDPSTPIRAATATILATYLPPSVELFEEVRPQGMFAYGGAVPLDVEGQADLLVQLKDDAGLDAKEVADAFADVTNAMLVSLTDRCAEISDNKAKLPNEEAEAATVSAVTMLADYARSAAAIFGKALPGVVIENGGIKYNGKVKKNKLEALFYSLMKVSSGMENIKAMLSSSEGSMPDDAAQGEARMDCLQHIFSISPGKRSSFGQRLTSDMIMDMMKGGGGSGGMGDLSQLFQSAGAGGGAGAGINEDMMREMMAEMSGGMPGGMPGGGGTGDMSGRAPESPEDVAAMLAVAAREMKIQLAQGTLGPRDVQEMEQSMGMDIGALINMLKMAKLAGGPNKKDIEDIIDTFEKLAKMKK